MKNKSAPRRIALSAVDRVYEDVSKLAEKVNYGRGQHAATVTRLLLNMYCEMEAIGLVNGTPEKVKLFKAAGLSHDIGVGNERNSDSRGHAGASLRMLKEQIWDREIPEDCKHLLTTVMYAVYYHRDSIPSGKLLAFKDIPGMLDYREIVLDDYQTTEELVALLRIADALDYGFAQGTPDKFEKIQLVRTSHEVECRATPRQREDVIFLLAKAKGKAEVFETRFGRLSFWLPSARRSWNFVV